MSFTQPTQALIEGSRVAPRQAHRDLLTARISQLKREIQALEGCYNSISLPNCIPAEILSNIFLLLARDERVTISLEAETLQWVWVTHVCRHWRRVALDCAELWSHLSFISPKFTELMLRRSKNAPLSVVRLTRPASRPGQDMIRRALWNCDRLKTVILSSHSREKLDLAFILSKWANPSPLLETLHILDYSHAPTRLPKGITAGLTCPLLRSLRLKNCNIERWESLPLSSSLTELALEAPPEWIMKQSRPTMEQFLSFLSTAKVLSTLNLRDFLPDGRGTSSRKGVLPVPLGNLEHLKLVDDAEAIGGFFESSSVPNAQGIRIAMDHYPSVEAIHSLMSKLNKSCGLQDRGGVQTLKITDVSDTNDEYAVAIAATYDPESPKRKLSLSLEFVESLPAAMLFTGTKDHLDLSPLSSLVVSGDCALTESDWKNSFTNLKHLKSISHEFGRISQSFLVTLAGGDSGPEADMDTDDQVVGVNYPHLAELALCDVDFDATYDGRDTASLLVSSLRSRLLSCPIPTPVRIVVWNNDSNGLTREIVRRIKESLGEEMVSFYFHDESVRRAMGPQGEVGSGDSDSTEESWSDSGEED